jgi:hypothetical protein
MLLFWGLICLPVHSCLAIGARSNRGWLFVTEQKVVRALNQSDGALVWQYGHNAIHGRHQGAHQLAPIQLRSLHVHSPWLVFARVRVLELFRDNQVRCITRLGVLSTKPVNCFTYAT